MTLDVCELGIKYDCPYWMEDHCRAYSPRGVAFRVRMLHCPLGNLPPKLAAKKTETVRLGQQKQKKTKKQEGN